MDVAHGEKVEAFNDAFIAQRERERRKTEGERLEEELYMDSVRRYNALQDQKNRAAWAEYHASQAERLRRTMEPLIAFHEAKALELENGHTGPGRGEELR